MVDDAGADAAPQLRKSLRQTGQRKSIKAPAADQNAFAAGSIVQIVGLVNAKDLNGHEGIRWGGQGREPTALVCSCTSKVDHGSVESLEKRCEPKSMVATASWVAREWALRRAQVLHLAEVRVALAQLAHGRAQLHDHGRVLRLEAAQVARLARLAGSEVLRHLRAGAQPLLFCSRLKSKTSPAVAARLG